jgi:hypothetical protein
VVVVAAAATVVVELPALTMKLTTVGPEGARNVMREKQRRNRLAAKELRVQYPQFSTIRVDLKFDDEVSQPPAPQSIVLHPPARAYFVYPCPYASCTGELDLAANVDHIAEQGKARTAGHAKCTGERQGPRGKALCDLHIEYSIAVGK